MTIEHGHANNFGNDYSSTAFWQAEPHQAVAARGPPRSPGVLATAPIRTTAHSRASLRCVLLLALWIQSIRADKPHPA